MGAAFASISGQGRTPNDGLAVALDAWVQDTDWPDPFNKGIHLVDMAPVAASAIEWMVGWTLQNPPEGVDPDDKWGPWLAFPLADGGWQFFGWVNT
jgi:hypothetical protein